MLDAARRKRAAIETYARHEATLRRTARRYSICADDAEDALQRALEILLRKAPSEDQRELVKWMQTVVKHEALAVRRERERILAGPAARQPEPDADDWVALIPSKADGPPERAERREAVGRSREALQSLKPQELRALTLLAEGYSYREIGEITGYSATKVNGSISPASPSGSSRWAMKSTRTKPSSGTSASAHSRDDTSGAPGGRSASTKSSRGLPPSGLRTKIAANRSRSAAFASATVGASSTSPRIAALKSVHQSRTESASPSPSSHSASRACAPASRAETSSRSTSSLAIWRLATPAAVRSPSPVRST